MIGDQLLARASDITHRERFLLGRLDADLHRAPTLDQVDDGMAHGLARQRARAHAGASEHGSLFDDSHVQTELRALQGCGLADWSCAHHNQVIPHVDRSLPEGCAALREADRTTPLQLNESFGIAWRRLDR